MNKLEGRNYSVDDTVVKLFDLEVKRQGHDFVTWNGSEEIIEPGSKVIEALWTTRNVINTRVATGEWFRTDRLIVPVFAGAAFCLIGFTKPRRGKIVDREDDSAVDIADTLISDRRLVVSIVNDPNAVITTELRS